MTTKEFIAKRQAEGDTLVANGWSVGYTTGTNIEGVQFHAVRFENGKIVEKDYQDFPTEEDARAYAFERGYLSWFSDWKAAR
jgi:hypothetical protein